jgi:hypothetical protein
VIFANFIAPDFFNSRYCMEYRYCTVLYRIHYITIISIV